MCGRYYLVTSIETIARLFGVNLNRATGAAFLTIPGMSDRMVHEFEEYRPYTSFEQFQREIGKYVDAKEVARLQRYLVIE